MKSIFLAGIMWLLLAQGAMASSALPWSTQGVIGDFAPTSGTYYIDGKSYQLPNSIVVENTRGQQVSRADLKGGVRVKVLGEKIFKGLTRPKVSIKRIIVLGH